MSERIVRRIDGQVTHMHRLSDEELSGYFQYAQDRLQSAQNDIDLIQEEMFRRAHDELPLGEIAVDSYIAIDPLEQ